MEILNAMTAMKQYDVIIIGAGPSGSVAGAMLVKKGYSVLILEKQHFPRFSIGESLLPQCMAFLEQAGLEHVLTKYAEQLNFQFKDGAAFYKKGKQSSFNFTEKFTDGPGTTFQVKRDVFDKLLADETETKGVEIRYGHQVDRVVQLKPEVVLAISNENEIDNTYQVKGKYLLDASGFGRVLPRLLELDLPSNFPVRHSFFSHFIDGIDCPDFDRDKILITVHPENERVWYWLIPFHDGRCSIGVVGELEWFEQFSDSSEIDILKTAISEDPYLRELLKNATFDSPVRGISGYSCNVKKLCGDGFALLGNAGEFLDPVFSSGVTIAMHSAHLAAKVLDNQLQGKDVDWQEEYVKPLCLGVGTFRTFVDTWYDGRLQSIIFSDGKTQEIKEMISSILAGYAWDTDNPYVAESRRKIGVLAKVCKEVYSN